FSVNWLESTALPLLEPASVYAPARLPVFEIVTEPVAESPIFIAEAEKIAPDPERVIESEPAANAFEAIEVGVAVKFAKVPPTAATATSATAASERRVFLNMPSLNMRVPFVGEWTRNSSERPG